MYWWDDVKMFASIFILVPALIGGLFIVIQHSQMSGVRAGLEQLRQDSKDINVGSDEAVMGKVVKMNMKIAERQNYNQFWWSCLFVPNDWDELEKIKIESKED